MASLRQKDSDGRAKTLRWLTLSLVCAIVAGAAATAAIARTATHSAARLLSVTTGATPPLWTGLQDPLFQGPQQTTAYAMTRDAGATYVRLFAVWRAIAPATVPNGFDPTDPTSPGYNWSALDASVSAAEAAGLTPYLNIVQPTPSWAFSVQPNGHYYGGTPQIGALGDFATAVARHYDGSGPAPPVHVFSVWNEPNINVSLYPQNPATYLAMVNAVADSVHAVDPTDLVVAGELAPYPHTPIGRDKYSVIAPLTFIQKMLCLSSGTPTQHTCAAQGHFDVWAHHPYSSTGPWGHAKRGGVALGDMAKMEALLQAAQQVGAIASAHPVPLWATEYGWSSNPPNPKGTPMTLETRWIAESSYQIWKSGATVAMNLQLQDQPLPSHYQTGLYSNSVSLSNATAKPLLSPFRFPFVAYLKSGGKVSVWGRDATTNRQDVTIQMRTGSAGSWQTVATITSNGYGIFQATLGLNAKLTQWLRAVAPGSGASTPFALRVPGDENRQVDPFP